MAEAKKKAASTKKPAAKKKTTKAASKTAKSTKSTKATTKKAEPKKVADKPVDTQTVSEVAKQASKTSSSKGIIAFLVVVIVGAFIAFVAMAGGSEDIGELSTYEADGYSISYPTEWTTEANGDELEFYSGEESDDSDAGLAVLDSGAIPGYESLTDTEKDELINLALESVKASDDTITAEFDDVVESTVELGTHPAADRALTFTFSGELKEGGQGTLVGYMLITEDGQTYVIFSGGNSDIYNDNSDKFNEMLQSFKLSEA